MKKGISIFSGLFFLFVIIFPAFGANNGRINSSGWKAGVSRVKITPKESLWMGGYASRTHPSDGKLTDLWAKALTLQDTEGTLAVLVTMDLVGISKSMSEHIRDRLQETYQLSRTQVILNTSHTHSGPALEGSLPDVYPMDAFQWERTDRYCRELEDKIVELVGKSMNSMIPVKLYAGNGVTRFQVNRRNNHEQTLTGQTELKGPNDHAVPVLKVVSTKGKLQAIVFGYACHGTVLDIYQWNGDYMGYAQMELEQLHRGATALFFQGAAGDQNPLPRRTIPLARQYGKELATAVERVLEEKMKPLEPVLKTAYSEIELSMETPPSEKELQEKINTSSGFEQRWAQRLLNTISEGKSLNATYSFPIAVWRLGDQLILALGGEPTIEYALKFKQLYGQGSFIMGYSNDVMAYIPSIQILKEGGYEGETSQIAYGLPSKWKPDLEDKIFQEIIKLTSQVGIETTKQMQESK
jgi:hypothetical protein